MSVANPMVQGRVRSRWAELGMIALFCVLWSSAFAPAKIAVRDCPPLLLLGVRFLIAGLICLWLARRRGEAGVANWRQVAALGLLGLLNNAIYLGFAWTGMLTVSSGFAAVLISANPLIVALVAVPVLGERLTARKMLGLVLGLAGVAIVLRSRIGGGIEDMGGTWLLVAGLVSLVAGTILYKRLAPPVGGWTGNGTQLLVAGLALLPVALSVEDLDTIRLTTPMLVSMAWMVLGVSVGGYFLWFSILARPGQQPSLPDAAAGPGLWLDPGGRGGTADRPAGDYPHRAGYRAGHPACSALKLRLVGTGGGAPRRLRRVSRTTVSTSIRCAPDRGAPDWGDSTFVVLRNWMRRSADRA